MVWQHMLVILATRRQRQEDCFKSEACLDYRIKHCLKKTVNGVSKMTQRVKVLAAKSEDPSSISSTHMVEKELLKRFSGLHTHV